MKNYISEGRAMYEDENHGLFSRKLAEWAISKMKRKDPTTKEMKPIKAPTLEETAKLLADFKVELPEAFIYTAWYLWAMSIADYPKALPTDAMRAAFVDETINDPDCCPEAVLDCFEAKMCLMGVPIHWERLM